MSLKKYIKANTGLFFGSFNPIHNGHLMIASYLLNFTDIDEIWFVVSPQSPFKKQSALLANHYRLEMVELALNNQLKMQACDIEFRLSVPSYTINTLVYLKEKYAGRNFSLIMGSDNLASFGKWKNYETILSEYQIYVYPRPNVDSGIFAKHASVKMTQAPQIEISSSFIRESIKQQKDMTYFLPAKVYQYIKDMHFYE